MYSRFHQTLLSILSQISETFGAMPILWNKVSKSYYVTLKSKQSYQISVALITSQAIYAATQIFRTFGSPKCSSWLDQSLLFVIFALTTNYLLSCTLYITEPDDFCNFLNNQTEQYHNFIKRFATVRIFPTRWAKSRQKRFETFALYLIVLSINASVNFALLSLVYPNNPIYPYSLFRNTSIILRIPLYICNFFYSIRFGTALVISYANITHQGCQGFYVYFEMLRDFKLPQIQVCTTPAELVKRLMVLRNQYRAVELSFKMFCRNFAKSLVSYLIILMPGVVLSSYTLFSYWNDPGMNMIVKGVLLSFILISDVTWFIIFTLGGHLTRKSQRVLCSWKHCDKFRRKERMILRRFQCSCRVLVFKHLTLGCQVKGETAGRFIVALSKGTFRTVLTVGIK